MRVQRIVGFEQDPAVPFPVEQMLAFRGALERLFLDLQQPVEFGPVPDAVKERRKVLHREIGGFRGEVRAQQPEIRFGVERFPSEVVDAVVLQDGFDRRQREALQETPRDVGRLRLFRIGREAVLLAFAPPVVNVGRIPEFGEVERQIAAFIVSNCSR